MRIALLNLPVDNNYGGNLQRYALYKTLESLGHDVTFLNLYGLKRVPFHLIPIKMINYFRKKAFNIHTPPLCLILGSAYLYKKHNKIAFDFIDKYIKHTNPIYNVSMLSNYVKFDCFVVGSDQVWRKSISHNCLSSMFFDFLPETTKRIAFSVSMGTEDNELTDVEVSTLRTLYNRFDAVSVREAVSISLFNTYHWILPYPVHTIDPTLLLDKDDYVRLIEFGDTTPVIGDVFCYLLDKTPEKVSAVQKYCKDNKLTPFYVSIDTHKYSISVEQWLRSFNEAKAVFTDSYHGLLFSIIFNKPFYLFKNPKRGNARFESVRTDLGLVFDAMEQDWTQVNKNRARLLKSSIDFLKKSLCNSI